MSVGNTTTYTTAGNYTFTKPPTDTLTQYMISGDFATAVIQVKGAIGGAAAGPLAALRMDTSSVITGNTAITDATSLIISVPSPGLTPTLQIVSIGSGNLTVTGTSGAFVGVQAIPSTSNGTIANPTLTGVVTISGNTTFSFMPIIPVANVTAAGTVLANATALTTGWCTVTGADGTTGVVLPATANGKQVYVKNNAAGAGALKVYPPANSTVNALSANTAISQAANTTALYTAGNATQWWSLSLLPS